MGRSVSVWAGQDATGRKPEHLVTPRYEDAGLFKSGIIHVSVELSPKVLTNSRGDHVVIGFAGSREPVRVVFAGRRKAEAGTLLRELAQLPDAGARVPAEIEGAWRRVIREDFDGFATRAYELVAARWTLTLAQSGTRRYGAAPRI